MHDAGLAPGHSTAGDGRCRVGAARDEAVALLARAGMPPPLQWPPDRMDPQADPFAPLLHALASPPAGSPGAGMGTGAGAAAGAGDPGTVHASRPRAEPDVPPRAPRDRLLRRVAASAADARRMHTLRHADSVARPLAAGVQLRLLYRAEAGQGRRPGEPERVALVELAPGAAWLRAASPLQQQCLVLRGRARLGDRVLQALDHRVQPGGLAEAERWSSERGALLLLRESAPFAATSAGTVAGETDRVRHVATDVAMAPALPADLVQPARTAPWADHAPGIRRRILWRQGAQAAMLYHALPGAAVPCHGHRHDEECLMLAGDFLLDEVLLRPLDYQIAPAGTGHRVARTDTGVVLYAHGDLDLDVR